MLEEDDEEESKNDGGDDDEKYKKQQQRQLKERYTHEGHLCNMPTLDEKRRGKDVENLVAREKQNGITNIIPTRKRKQSGGGGGSFSVKQ